MTSHAQHSEPSAWPLAADCGLLLVGHGSREQVGTEQFLETAAQVQRLCGTLPVEPCFLEFASPTIDAGFRSLVRRGVRRVVVAPVLLFSAGHAKRDIPEAVARVAAEFPQVEVRQAAHLGSQEKLLELSRQRYLEALGTQAARPSWLVLVGRGSHDAQATEEMQEYAQRLAATLSAAGASPRRVEVAFVAMAKPSLDEVLEQAAASGTHSVVVQPHLLFGGVLADRIANTVHAYAGRYPELNWIAARPLGPAAEVAAAIVERAGRQAN